MHSHALFLYLEMLPLPSPLTDQLLDPKDRPAFYQPKAHKFFALNPSHVVSWLHTHTSHAEWLASYHL